MKGETHCDAAFALIQDGTPMQAGIGLELMGRLPEPETLVLLTRRDNTIRTFEDLRNKSIGIGPEGSGTAFLMRQLFADPDLADLKIDMPAGDLEQQARSVSEGRLDLVAYVIRSDAEFLRTIIRQYNLDIVELKDLPGLVDRYRWLTLGRIPAGASAWSPPLPEADKPAAQVNTPDRGQFLRQACGPDRISLAAQRRDSGFHQEQSAGLDQLAPPQSRWQRKPGNSLPPERCNSPIAISPGRQSDVAGLLGLSADGPRPAFSNGLRGLSRFPSLES